METDRGRLRRPSAPSGAVRRLPAHVGWYFPADGLWFVGITAVQGLTDDHPPVAVVLLALLGASCGWYARCRGAMPSVLRRAPTRAAGCRRRP